MAWRLLVLLPLLPVVRTQPVGPHLGPTCFEPSRQPCVDVASPEDLLQNSSGLCPERVWPQNYWGSYWANYTQLDQSSVCYLPLEVRVGLTMSLSGHLYDSAAAAKILQMLVNLSSSGPSLPGFYTPEYCIHFCVLDDQSSPRRAAELYRSFAGEAGEAHEVDFLLGPATYDFRSIAAQVAQESQKPLLLWSTTPSLGSRVLSQSQDIPPSEAMEQVRNLRALRRDGGLPEVVPPDCGDLCQALQDSPLNSADTCAQLNVPAGRALRPLAQFLSCEGPCDVATDLDYCTWQPQGLSAPGNWSPATALLHGGWHQGCLKGVAAGGSQTSVQLVLHLEESPAKVHVMLNSSMAPAGELRLQDSAIFPGEWIHIIIDGAELVFVYAGDADIEWEVCLVQGCAGFACNASYVADPTGACASLACDPQVDHEACCIKEAQPDMTLLDQHYLSTTVDLALPPSYWLTDLLPRLLREDKSELFVCLAQNDPRGLFRDLCRIYIKEALAAGFQTLPNGPLTLNADNSVADIITRLQHVTPLPQVVLVSADLSVYTSFINGLITTQAVFTWVISAFPFDQGLRNSVPAHTLFYNTLETGPWPPFSKIEEYAAELAEARAAVAMLQSGISIQELYLSSAGQILNTVIWSNYQNFSARYQIPQGPGITPVLHYPVDDGRLGFLYFLRAGVSQVGPGGGAGGFSTLLGQVYFGGRGGRINLQREDFSSWAHDTLPSLVALSEPLSAADSWLYSQARFSISELREIRSASLTPGIWPLGRKVLDTYPCPIGCRATNRYTCVACAPGYYQAMGETGCVPCTQLAKNVFQDSWAGAMCHQCPAGAYCEEGRPAQEPISLPGYYRVENTTWMQNFHTLSVETACSFSGGLADVHATEIESWLEAKRSHQWLFQRCVPEEACLGNNVCFKNNRGVACTSCIEGYTKYESYFAYTTCKQCASTAILFVECFVPAFVQFLIIAMLSKAGMNSAVNRLSLAAPICIALVQGLQMHSTISKALATSGAAREELGRFVYVSTWTELVTAPCLLPWMFCKMPIQNEADVMNYVLLVIVSCMIPSAFYFLLQLFHLCRGRANSNTLVRATVASNQLVLANLLRATMEVTKCSEDPNQRLTLEIERSVYCPQEAFQGLNLARNLVIIFCSVVWVGEFFVHWRTLKDWKYLHVQEKFSLLYLKILPSMWYWRFLDEFRIITAIYWFSDGSLSKNFSFQVVAVMELVYSSLLAWFAPYTRMGADTMLRQKAAISKNLGVVSLLFFLMTWIEPSTVAEEALNRQPFLVSLDAFLDRFAVGDVILSLSGLHIFFSSTMKLLDNRGALSYALKAQTGTPTRCGSVMLRLLRSFPGAHSMMVHHDGESVLLDTRDVPPHQRRKLLIGVASGLRYIFGQSGIFRVGEVRNQIKDATAMVALARKARFMIKTSIIHAHAFQTIWKGGVAGEIETEHEHLMKLNMAEKRVMEAELSAAVEDMCDHTTMQEHRVQKHGRARKKRVVEEEDEEALEERFKMDQFKARNHATKTIYYRERKKDGHVLEIDEAFEQLDMSTQLTSLQALERKLWALMFEEGFSEMEVQDLPGFGQRLVEVLFKVQAFQSLTQKLGEFEPVGDTDARRRGSAVNFSQQIMRDARAIKERNDADFSEMMQRQRSGQQNRRSAMMEDANQLLPQGMEMDLSESSSSVLSSHDSGEEFGDEAYPAQAAQEQRRASVGGESSTTKSVRAGGRTFLPMRLRADWMAEEEPAASLVPALDRPGLEDGPEEQPS